MDEPTESISTATLIHDNEQVGEQEIEGKLKLLEELLDSVTECAETDCLEMAISSLQAALDSGTHDGESHVALYHQLNRALLVRYSLYGWMDDLDTCFLNFARDVGVERSLEHLLLRHNSDEISGEVQVSAQLIEACRNSIDIADLNNLVCMATEALDSYELSYSGDKIALQITKLRILLGKALVMKYLNDGEIIQLDQATQCLQQRGIGCMGDTTLEYMALASLQHIELLKLVECGDREAYDRFADYYMKQWMADEEGRNLYDAGTAMIEQGGDLQEGITLLTASLNSRAGAHPQRSIVLNALFRALITCFRETENYEALEDAIKIAQEALDLHHLPHPKRPSSLMNVGSSVVIRFEYKRVFEDLEDGIALQRETLDLCPPPHLLRSMSLSNLATSLSTRFTHRGAFEDLEESITLHREALGLPQSPHADRSLSLNNLASSLSVRFRHKGACEDLEESITLQREALDLRRPPHPDRSLSLDSLASSLSTRFRHKGAFEDLEESITLHREALDLVRPPHPDRSTSLNNLANSLSTRFEHKGAFEDLEESITLHREALDLPQSPHTDHSLSLNNLAGSLSVRFRHKGAFDDLEESITLHREALDLPQLPHTDRSFSRNNLASSLSVRFKHKGAFEDLEESITLHREALDLRRPPHPDRLTSLNNLANSLSARFLHKGAFEDLEESITLHREALDLVRPPHPDRSMSLNNLASSLSARFRHKGAFEDLEESITLQRKALDLVRPPHPDRSMSLNNLASSLSTRFKHKGSFEDLEESITLHREALDLVRPPHPDRLMSLNNLASSLSTRFEHKGAFEDLEESIKLHREALKLCQAPHPACAWSLNNLATSLLTRFGHKEAFEDLEECITLLQGALHLPPHPTRSGSLGHLALSLSYRFERKGKLSDIEDALQYYHQAVKYPTGSLLDRLTLSLGWFVCARNHCPASILDAFMCSMELLPQLASLDLTVQQRQDVLQHGQYYACEGAKCAMDADQIELAITFLSTGRSMFWSQALQLRTPVDELMATHPAIAKKFITVSRYLENASYSQQASASSSSVVGETSVSTSTHPSPYKVANQRQEIIGEIREIPGYEGFLLPHSFPSLKPAAKKGPIIFLNASILRCDAIAMHGAEHPEVIPLPDIHWKQLQNLKMLIHDISRSGMRSVEISQDMMDTFRKWLGRDMVLENSADSSEEIFRSTLESLWVKIVQPIVNTLCIEKTESPTRIWWCPTGPFSSLPIHAAGVYSTENEPIDCLFQYAVSSYITSPQDLLHSPPSIMQSRPYNVTAVIEPETIDQAAALPFTVHELQKIVVHVPHQHLVAKVGSKRTPNQIEDIVSSIQQSSFVHFGCHGKQSLKDPLESCLLLSGGRLTMSKLMKECRVPEGALAYLSACETAKGDDVRPDESLNLVATMMFAGFRSVVGTMWSILDCDAPIVADVFYQHLFRNGAETPPDVTDAAYGLHLATKKLRDEGRPFYSWVPYVHYGI